MQQRDWRKFFQRVWQNVDENINYDLKNDQHARVNNGMPISVDGSTTGIDAIDESIVFLKENGYMHNHVRM